MPGPSSPASVPRAPHRQFAAGAAARITFVAVIAATIASGLALHTNTPDAVDDSGCPTYLSMSYDEHHVRSQRDFDALAGQAHLHRVTIEGPDVVSLAPLTCARSIDELTIKNAPALRSLTGLETLSRVTELSLQKLPALTSVQGLRGLEQATTLRFNELPQLRSLEGLKLRSAQDVFLVDVDKLVDLHPLQHMHVWSRAHIVSNDALRSLAGLQAGDVDGQSGMPVHCRQTIHVEDNPSLLKLDLVTGPCFQEVIVVGNAKLRNVDGLAGLRTVGRLEVLQNGALDDASGLNGLQTVHDRATLAENPLLRLLPGSVGPRWSVSPYKSGPCGARWYIDEAGVEYPKSTDGRACPPFGDLDPDTR